MRQIVNLGGISLQNRRKKLVFWRIDRRLRQRDVASELGITTVHYSNLERGLSNPSYEILVKFRDTFNVKDVLDLFDKEQDQNGDNDTTRNIIEEQILD